MLPRKVLSWQLQVGFPKDASAVPEHAKVPYASLGFSMNVGALFVHGNRHEVLAVTIVSRRLRNGKHSPRVTALSVSHFPTLKLRQILTCSEFQRHVDLSGIRRAMFSFERCSVVPPVLTVNRDSQLKVRFDCVRTFSECLFLLSSQAG